MAVFLERFDQNKLNYILRNKDKYEDEIRRHEESFPSPARVSFLKEAGIIDKNNEFDYFAVATKYLQLSHKGTRLVAYNYAKGSNKGRLYAKDGVSLQNMSCKIRNTIARDFYQDLDMVNAHPTILLSLCRKFNIKCTKLEKYVYQRDSVIKTIMDANEMSRDDVKQVFLAIMNGGKKLYNKVEHKSKFLINFKKEMDRTLQAFADCHPDVLRERKRVKPNNPLGSTMNWIVCIYENQILQTIVDFLRDKKQIKDSAVLCFDGLMIPKAAKINIQDIENHIFHTTQIPIKLKIKDMDDALNVPSNIPQYTHNPNNHIIRDCLLPYKQLYAEKAYIEKQYKQLRYDQDDGEQIDELDESQAAYARASMQIIAYKYSQYIMFQRTEGKLFAWLQKATPASDNSGKIRSSFQWNSYEVNNAFYQAYDIVLPSEDSPLQKDFSVIKYLINNCPFTITIDACQNFPGRDLIVNQKVKNSKTQEMVILNSWKGRAMDPQEIVNEIESTLSKKQINQFTKRIKNHIYQVLAPDKNEGQYVENWIACVLNDPTFFPGVATSFTSLPGAGKSKFMDNIFSQYFGSAYCRSSGFDPKALGNDNIFLGTDIVVIDEIQISNKDSFDRLKNLITENTLKIRKMYRDAETGVFNNTKFVFNSNHIDPFPFEGPNQRRFAKFRCSDVVIGNDEYFTKLYDEIPKLFFPYYFIKLWTDEFAESMKTFKFRNPKTVENEKSKAGHLSICTKFSVHLTKSVLRQTDTFVISLDELYNLFVDFCEENKVKHVLSKHNFIRNEDLQAILVQNQERKRVNGVRLVMKTLNSIDTVAEKIKERFDLDLDDIYI